MAITFAVRGDSLDARYSSAGKSPAILGVNDPAAVNTDHAGINGSTSIDLAGSVLSFRGLNYIGKQNTPSVRARSVLIRAKFQSLSGTVALWGIGGLVRNPVNFLGAYISTGQVNVSVSNEAAATDGGVTVGASLTSVVADGGSAAWHDIVVTWTGTTATNGMEIWIDGTRLLQDTMTRELPATFNTNQQLSCLNIAIGTEWVQQNTFMFVDEFVIWDEVIDPTSVGLTSGSGSLNGSSRSAYVDVANYDGLNSSGSTGGVHIGGINF